MWYQMRDDIELLNECVTKLGIQSFNLKKTRITSPFRKDRRPGCYFWVSRDGKVFFVDWASDKTHMHISEFYERISGSSFFKVNYDHNGNFSDRKFKKAITCYESTNPNHIRLAQEYWNRFGVNYDDVKRKYGVFAVSRYVMTSPEGKKEFVVNDNELCLCIYKDIQNNVKLYYPLRSRNGSNPRFISSIPSNHIEFLFRISDKLIITKSKKDAILLDGIYRGIYDICWVQSETVRIPRRIAFKLFMHYKTIRIFFDNDDAGTKNANRFAYYLSNLFPTKDIQILQIPIELGCKDPGELFEFK